MIPPDVAVPPAALGWALTLKLEDRQAESVADGQGKLLGGRWRPSALLGKAQSQSPAPGLATQFNVAVSRVSTASLTASTLLPLPHLSGLKVTSGSELLLRQR